VEEGFSARPKLRFPARRKPRWARYARVFRQVTSAKPFSSPRSASLVAPSTAAVAGSWSEGDEAQRRRRGAPSLRAGGPVDAYANICSSASRRAGAVIIDAKPTDKLRAASQWESGPRRLPCREIGRTARIRRRARPDGRVRLERARAARRRRVPRAGRTGNASEVGPRPMGPRNSLQTTAMGDAGLEPATSALSRWNRVGKCGQAGIVDGIVSAASVDDLGLLDFPAFDRACPLRCTAYVRRSLVWQIRRLGGDQVTAAAGASTVDRMGFAGSWTKRDPPAAGQPCVRVERVTFPTRRSSRSRWPRSGVRDEGLRRVRPRAGADRPAQL